LLFCDSLFAMPVSFLAQRLGDRIDAFVGSGKAAVMRAIQRDPERTDAERTSGSTSSGSEPD
jgi:hypothetical protein